MLQMSETFFVLQIGDKSDSVSVDRLKPVFSSVPVVPADPPLGGRPLLVPALVPRPLDPRPEPALVPGPPGPGCPRVKKVRFSPVPATQLCRNPYRTMQGSRPLSPVLRPYLLWGVTCGYYKIQPSSASGQQIQRELSSNALSCTALSGSRLNLFPFPVAHLFFVY